MGCGGIISTSNKTSEITKKADLIILSNPREENEKINFDKDLEKEGCLESNRKGKPALLTSKKKTKHWLFEVEEVQTTEAAAFKPWHGLYKPPEGIVQRNKKELDIDLEIEHIYGFNCVGSRNNVFFCKNPEFIVFPAGTLGIVLDINNNKQKIFREHEDEITALTYNPINDIVATADKRHSIFIWNTSKLQTINMHKISEKGTLSLSFTLSGDILILLSASFKISIYKWATFDCISSLTITNHKIYSVQCSKFENIASIIGEKYAGFLLPNYTIEKGIFGAKGKICNMVCSTWIDKKCYTGGTNGQIYIWIPPTLEAAYQIFELGVTIHAIKIHKDDIICSGADRNIMILGAKMEFKRKISLEAYAKSIDFIDENILVGLATGIIGIINEEFKELVWGFNCNVSDICICSDTILFVSGFCEVNIIDYTKFIRIGKINERVIKVLANRFDTDMQVTSLEYAPNKEHLAIGTSKGVIEIYHYLNNYRGIIGIPIDSKSINKLKYSNDESYLCCACENNIIILETNEYSIVEQCSLYGIIRSLDWDTENTSIQASTNLNELCYYAIDGPEFFGSSKIYATWTSKIGWPLAVYQENQNEFSHIVSVSSSKNLDYLAFGDDWGFIHLSLFPASKKTKKIKAHESQVDLTLWTQDNEKMFSLGNKCMIQWKIVKNNKNFN
ncbi:hypothetical protein SteCoe_6960 [Stentor coeruleus]|uniref:EML-like second beta-propeller domain-containing protein n=1 Tax=Stentor coeruleus TaxID=5963 RepID=A0A1R2CNV7_9CILI|nr:hypothetical protein SteCoe_6960 [Stentor coeruleus]